MIDAVGNLPSEELDRIVAHRAAGRRARRRADQEEKFPKEAQLWMALAPGWTVPLAEASGFPAVSVAAVFAEMYKDGLVELRRDTYVMNEVGRTRVLQRYLD